MSEDKKKSVIYDDIIKMLNACYERSLHGINKVSPPIDEFANDYLKKKPDNKKAAKAMLKNQIAKCQHQVLLQVLVDLL